MKSTAIGCCGLNCEDCLVFIATVNNDENLRQKTAEEWSKLYSEHVGKTGLKPKDMNCTGCKSEKRVFVGCLNCPIRRCCGKKKSVTCANCEKFETCDILNGFYAVPAHQSAKDNLNRIRAR
jgi:hypothetical protein